MNHNIKRAIAIIALILGVSACTPRQFAAFSTATSEPGACVLLAGHTDNDSREYLTSGVVNVTFKKKTWTGTREDGSRLVMGYALEEDSEIWNLKSCL